MQQDVIYSIKDDKIKLPVVIKAQAKQNQITEVINGKLKILIAATPVDGKANKELINFIAKLFKLKKSNVTILSGANNPYKILELPMLVKPALDQLIFRL